MKGVLPLRWRHVRWVLAAGALPVIWACNSPPLAPPTPAPERTVNEVFQAAVNRDIDILFMVDNSPSMRPLQTKLATNFPIFINTLSGLPGGLPNVHIAVVSSDMGSGPMAPTQQCRVGGDGGQFQTTPRVAGCTSGLPADQHFFASVNGMKNFTGDIATDFACVAQLGDLGCGFEHQFASMLRALEPGGNLPATNANFLRPTAFLSIILITNEDDCSAPPDSNLFDTNSQLVSDPLGPLASYRCNEFGHLCMGMKPPRTPAMLTGCTSAEDGRLLKVAEVIDRTKALKGGDLSKILVAAVAGPPTPYNVVLAPGTTATGVTEQQPNIQHSCQEATDNTYADPGVRLKMWVDAFKGTYVSICDRTFEKALTQIADAIGKAIGPQCVEGKLVDSDLNTPGIQPDCVVSDITTNAQGQRVETPLPSCIKSNNAHPCWEPRNDPASCNGANKTLINVNRDGAKPSDLNTSVSCAVCIPGTMNPGCN
ncbi:MAG TPA: hypothetical protein VNO55_25905 [Polyangia bacterium]|nr:hypothetical protein [Polyangia bacterium]